MIYLAIVAYAVFVWLFFQYCIDKNDYKKMTGSAASEEWHEDRIKIIEGRKIWLIALACFGLFLGIFLTYLHYH